MGRSAVLKFSFTFNLAQLAMPMIGRIVAALKSLLALLSMTSCNDSIYHRGMKNIEFGRHFLAFCLMSSSLPFVSM